MKTPKPSPNYPKWKITKSLMLLAAALCASTIIESKTQAAQRPISDFISQQGTYFPFPPWLNYLSWTDPDTGEFAVFDYAGLADAEAGGAFGTELSGSINERPLADGRAEVSIILHAKHAFAWSTSFDLFPATLFGHVFPEVLNGAPASFGDCTLQLVIINTAPGAPLPDLVALTSVPTGIPLLSIGFTGESHGTLADGSPGFMETRQTGLFRVAATANPNSRVALDGFPAEHVTIQATGGK